MIRTATTADAEAICAIYNHYVLETAITFEEAAVTPAEMAGVRLGSNGAQSGMRHQPKTETTE